MRLLGLVFLSGALAAGSAQATSILVIESPQTPRSGSTVILESRPAASAIFSAKAVQLSYPTPSFDATTDADPFRLTRSMIAVGTASPVAPVAEDETTAAIPARSKRHANLPPMLIRAGVKTEPAMHMVAPPRKPASSAFQAKAKPEHETAEEKDEEAMLPATKPGAPL